MDFKENLIIINLQSIPEAIIIKILLIILLRICNLNYTFLRSISQELAWEKKREK